MWPVELVNKDSNNLYNLYYFKLQTEVREFSRRNLGGIINVFFESHGDSKYIFDTLSRIIGHIEDTIFNHFPSLVHPA